VFYWLNDNEFHNNVYSLLSDGSCTGRLNTSKSSTVPRSIDNFVNSQRFSKFFHWQALFAIELSLKISPHQKRVPTLPCEV